MTTKRDIVVRLLFTPSEAKAVKKAAEAASLPVAVFCRIAALQAVEAAKKAKGAA